jgi:hypothetical protein
MHGDNSVKNDINKVSTNTKQQFLENLLIRRGILE